MPISRWLCRNMIAARWPRSTRVISSGSLSIFLCVVLRPAIGIFTNSAISFTDKSVLNPFCSARYSNGLLTTVASTEPPTSAAKRASGAAREGLQDYVFVRVYAIAAKHLVNGEISGAAEGVDGNPFTFERFDTVNFGS